METDSKWLDVKGACRYLFPNAHGPVGKRSRWHAAGKSSLHMILSLEERQTLERWQCATTITAGLAHRGKIILLLAAGCSQTTAALAVGEQRTVLRHWAKRFLAQRLDGFSDAPGRGARGPGSPAQSLSTRAWPRDPHRPVGSCPGRCPEGSLNTAFRGVGCADQARRYL